MLSFSKKLKESGELSQSNSDDYSSSSFAENINKDQISTYKLDVRPYSVIISTDFSVIMPAEENIKILLLNNIKECIGKKNFTNNIQDNSEQCLSEQARMLIVLDNLVKLPTLQEYLNNDEEKQRTMYSDLKEISKALDKKQDFEEKHRQMLLKTTDHILEVIRNLSWYITDDLTRASPLASLKKLNNDSLKISDDFVTNWLMHKYKMNKDTLLYRVVPLYIFNSCCIYVASTKNYIYDVKNFRPSAIVVDYYNQNDSQKELIELTIGSHNFKDSTINVGVDIESVRGYLKPNKDSVIINLKLQDILDMKGKIYPDESATLPRGKAFVFTVPNGQIHVNLVEKICKKESSFESGASSSAASKETNSSKNKFF